MPSLIIKNGPITPSSISDLSKTLPMQDSVTGKFPENPFAPSNDFIVFLDTSNALLCRRYTTPYQSVKFYILGKKCLLTLLYVIIIKTD